MSLRSKVLASFKKLHRARQVVFKGDQHALSVIRSKINDEYRQRIEEKDPAVIEEMIQVAEESEMLLRKTVVQAEVKDDNTYSLKLREDNLFVENTQFNPDAEIPTRKRRSKKCDDWDS